jgi:hypothetical protein
MPSGSQPPSLIAWRSALKQQACTLSWQRPAPRWRAAARGSPLL